MYGHGQYSTVAAVVICAWTRSVPIAHRARLLRYQATVLRTRPCLLVCILYGTVRMICIANCTNMYQGQACLCLHRPRLLARLARLARLTHLKVGIMDPGVVLHSDADTLYCTCMYHTNWMVPVTRIRLLTVLRTGTPFSSVDALWPQPYFYCS